MEIAGYSRAQRTFSVICDHTNRLILEDCHNEIKMGNINSNIGRNYKNGIKHYKVIDFPKYS